MNYSTATYLRKLRSPSLKTLQADGGIGSRTGSTQLLNNPCGPSHDLNTITLPDSVDGQSHISFVVQ